jgi:hypothetical protein
MARDAENPILNRPFADGRLALQVSSEAWAFPFAEFAQALADAERGTIVERVGALGTDEVYWDIRLGGGQVLTLHGQHFLGVFLCATDEPSEACLRGLQPMVEAYLRDRRRPRFSSWLRSTWRRFRATMMADHAR